LTCFGLSYCQTVICFFKDLFLLTTKKLQDICSEKASIYSYTESIILQKEYTQMYSLIETPHKDDGFFLNIIR